MFLFFLSVFQSGSSSRSIVLQAGDNLNELQTYNLTSLDVGNTYRFSIATNNNVGSSAVVDFASNLVFPETCKLMAFRAAKGNITVF